MVSGLSSSKAAELEKMGLKLCLSLGDLQMTAFYAGEIKR